MAGYNDSDMAMALQCLTREQKEAVLRIFQASDEHRLAFVQLSEWSILFGRADGSQGATSAVDSGAIDHDAAGSVVSVHLTGRNNAEEQQSLQSYRGGVVFGSSVETPPGLADAQVASGDSSQREISRFWTIPAGYSEHAWNNKARPMAIREAGMTYNRQLWPMIKDVNHVLFFVTLKCFQCGVEWDSPLDRGGSTHNWAKAQGWTSCSKSWNKGHWCPHCSQKYRKSTGGK